MSQYLSSLVHLDACLSGLAWLWRPAPFHTPWPPWADSRPDLAQALMDLEEDRVEALASDPAALVPWLDEHVPGLADLEAATRLAPSAHPPFPAAERLTWGIPGRKLDQITAFAQAIGAPRGPVLEWCAGKGHLGRLLAGQWAAPVASLELDPGLCRAGEGLASRAGVSQSFISADALAPASTHHLKGCHGVALHACGDLHLALLKGAADRGAAALDLAPCCYYRTAAPVYQPLNPEAALPLSRDELHLPVTETVTAGARERRLRDRHMAWKLAFLAWRERVAPDRRGVTFKPVPAAWLAGDFAGFLERLASREGLPLPTRGESATLEAKGWLRRHQVARLGLPRLAFRRALEVWLARDRALYLERAGYQVTLGVFCPRQVTPRNLLISARR